MNVRTACPVNPAHGRVLDAPGERWAFYCPHQDHDGRPATHPLGAMAGTRSHFTTTEVERGEVAATPPPAVSALPEGHRKANMIAKLPTTRGESQPDPADGSWGAVESGDEVAALRGSPDRPLPPKARPG